MRDRDRGWYAGGQDRWRDDDELRRSEWDEREPGYRERYGQRGMDERYGAGQMGTGRGWGGEHSSRRMGMHQPRDWERSREMEPSTGWRSARDWNRDEDEGMDRNDYPTSFGSPSGRDVRPYSTGFYRSREDEWRQRPTLGRDDRYREDRWRYGADRDDDRGVLERAADWVQRKIAGKPPKGYRRSDDRIREEVCETIMRRGDIDASEVDIVVANGEVTLSGTVPDRRSKRRLEDIAEDILGVEDVHNRIKVARHTTEEMRSPNGDRDRIATTTRPSERTPRGTT
jgi:hypothetical protein